MEATATRTSAQRAQQLAAAPNAVRVQELSKAFRLPHERYSTLKERVLHPFTTLSFDMFHALEDVGFDVKRGEFYGIVGRNGSGKSTLLKCLAGIYGADAGTIEVDGRISPFIELGVGFNPDLTARDNVVINAVMLGLSRREARRRFDAIIEFAELEEFIDLKLKNYSSGMSVRLGFSVAIQVDAEILLVDEVLAVGDASFQRKCFDQFDRMRAENRTILFVTHDMNSVERFCDRAMLIERGHVLEIGAPSDITRHYNEVNFGSAPELQQAFGRLGASARLERTWCENARGEPIVTAQYGERCVVCIEVSILDAAQDLMFAATLTNEVKHATFVPSSGREPITGPFVPGERIVVRLAFENWLAPGKYALTPTVATVDPAYRVLDHRPEVAALVVESPFETGGVVDIPTELDIERL